MKLIRRVCLIGLLLTRTAAAQAQPSPHAPGPQDEGFVIEQSHTTQRFEADGTGRRETSMRIKTQSDAGVRQWGQIVTGYNAATETLEIPFVRVHKADGSIVETPASAIQDLTSPVQRVAPVYTDFREKHVTVDSLRPGDTLEFRTITTIHTALAPGQFWMDYTFNDESIVLDEQLDVDVPAPVQVLLKLRPGVDPTTKDAGGRRVYHWSHSHAVRDDENDAKKKKNASGDPEYPPIRLTTFQNWEAVGRWFQGLEETARTPTAEVRRKAQELTAGKPTDLEKLEALYDFVAKSFRYVSLSLGTGRYQPRAAASVLRDAYGDCKDKHTLLASLIDAAGLKASAVLINSQRKIDPDVPSPSQFDHVITRAEIDGKPVWLDTTAEVAPFGFILFPLRDRQALLVLPGGMSRLERTPLESAVRTTVRTNVDATLGDDGTLAADLALTFRGDLEVAARAAFRATPETQWKTIVESIGKQTVPNGKVTNVRVSSPEETREPFSIGFHVEAPSYTRWTTKTVELPLPFIRDDRHDTPPESGTIRLGATGEVTYALRLRVPAGAVPQLPLPVSMVRDYADYRSSYTAAGPSLTVERTFTIKKPELDEDRRDDYAAFLRVVTSDNRQHIAIDAAHVSAGVTAASASAEAKALGERGYAALTAGDFDEAVTLLKRCVEAEPKDKSAWNNLGRAYAGLHRLPEAIDAYKTAIAVNPYDAYAYNNLGLVYVQQRRYPEAESAYLKQLDVDPRDRFSMANLGRMYNEQHLYDKAAAVLEKAISVAPTVASYHVQLGKAYLNLQRNDEALAAFDKAAEISPTPGIWNDVAYELSLARVDLDRAQRYAESAVSTIVALSRNVDVNNADAEALASVRSLAAYWDTLGWVWFAKGDLTKAEKYVAAAWTLAQHAEVGDHVGQVVEKQGRRDAAIAAYARALAAERPAASVRHHLVALAGAARADALVAQYRGDLVAARTIPVGGRGPAGKRGDFFVAFAQTGRPDSVRFITGDAEIAELASEIQKIRLEGMFPDDQPTRLLRRLAVACGADGQCRATLVLPGDAQPAK